MFDPQEKPRVFGLPPGADFPRALVDHLIEAHHGQPPEALAQVRIIVNTRRMERRITELFHQGPALLLPRIELVGELEHGLLGLPPASSPLRRRLELTRLIASLLDAQPDLAARSSLYDLADSLASLIDEMHGEGIHPNQAAAIDVANHSAHWARTQAFLSIATNYLADMQETPDARERQSLAVDLITSDWQQNPPETPIILAGSTGSWATTRRLMCAVAKLPQGAIILPGFDFAMSLHAWADLNNPLTAEDHPQTRFRRLMEDLKLAPADILPWPHSTAPNPARNALVSLALRPAPVTDCWLEEGPKLPDLAEATLEITLLEAPSRRHEALSIALRLRQAAEDGQSAALITPDRMLTRQVAAHLDRWRLIADDSAGEPLHLSAPGRFLRHTSALLEGRLTAEALLVILKHPLCHAGEGRKLHLRNTRLLELQIRRHGMPFPAAETLTAWAETRSPEVQEWMGWLVSCLANTERPEAPLTDLVKHHLALAQRLSAGGADNIPLWEGEAGLAAQTVMQRLQAEAAHGGLMESRDYSSLISALLMREVVRSAVEPHPLIRIWGTLEARVMGSDLLILGSLNDGSWPAALPPDPWMNRAMRLQAKMRLPEVRLGLAAHDFQQAIGAKEVWLTRSLRSDDAQSVPSRWLNRLTNLLEGLPEQGGQAALKAMRARGGDWLAKVAAIEAYTSTASATRPAPIPPKEALPKKLSVTQIKTLVRDPYAIYAREILKLQPLDPLMQSADARLKGIALHEVFERFLRAVKLEPSLLTVDHLLAETETILAENVPWPEVRMLWSARLRKLASAFIEEEVARQSQSSLAEIEAVGVLSLPAFDLTLKGKADRIDRASDGTIHLYDYKTGSPPTPAQQKHFDRQLQIEAAMIRRGAFKDVDPADVSLAAYLEVSSKLNTQPAELVSKDGADQIAATWEWLNRLLSHYLLEGAGFTARKQMERSQHASPYDHLSRYGEWDETQTASPEVLE